jgi:hypothetical protein
VCRRERGLPLSATSACGSALAGDALSVRASRDNKKAVVRLLQRILQRAKFREASPSAKKPLISTSAVALFERAALKLGEGLIEGKRCGVTQNIGPAARRRRKDRQLRRINFVVT